MRPRLLTKRGQAAPVTNRPPSGMRSPHQEYIDSLFMTDAEEDAAIAQAIEEDDRGESIPLAEHQARMRVFMAELEAEARRKMSK